LESDRERPEHRALRELENVVRAMGEEISSLRRRAQGAESRLREQNRGEQLALQSESPAPGKNHELERENAELRARLESARERAKGLAERLRFLRQQRVEQGQ
jgi:Sec-independent protein translocase protein TatA